MGLCLVSTSRSTGRKSMNVRVQREKPRGDLLCLLIRIKLCEIEGTTCLLLEEKLRISKIITLAEALNTGKNMGYGSWHRDRMFFSSVF